VADSDKKGARITATDRSKLAGELKKKYTSVRAFVLSPRKPGALMDLCTGS